MEWEMNAFSMTEITWQNPQKLLLKYDKNGLFFRSAIRFILDGKGNDNE